jgi:hypothetical protein
MTPVATIAQVFDAIQQVKAGASDFLTNFYPARNRIQDWIDHGELAGVFRSDAVFFLRRDRDFRHLYYCAADRTALERSISAASELGSERVVLDIVGTEEGVRPGVEVWTAAGFRQRTRLLRMVRAVQPVTGHGIEGDGEVELAKPADARDIQDLLERSFDRFGEQLPLGYEIESAIEAGQILAARHGEKIAGLLFFETQGFSSTLRFWAVAGEYQGHKFGSRLMRRYFATQSLVRRFVLWVAADNARTIEKYSHYGYKPDVLVDYVLANQQVRP